MPCTVLNSISIVTSQFTEALLLYHTAAQQRVQYAMSTARTEDSECPPRRNEQCEQWKKTDSILALAQIDRSG